MNWVNTSWTYSIWIRLIWNILFRDITWYFPLGYQVLAWLPGSGVGSWLPARSATGGSSDWCTHYRVLQVFAIYFASGTTFCKKKFTTYFDTKLHFLWKNGPWRTEFLGAWCQLHGGGHGVHPPGAPRVPQRLQRRVRNGAVQDPGGAIWSQR